MRENPAVSEFQNLLSIIHLNIGRLRAQTGRADVARESLQQALVIQDRLARENPTVTAFQKHLAESHTITGDVEQALGRSDTALESYARALPIWERLAREHPESPYHAHALGGTLSNMATMDMVAGRFAAARDRLHQAIIWQKRALKVEPKQPAYLQFLTNHWTNLIDVLQNLGRDDERAEAQRELAELRASDPRFTALDARLDVVIGGGQPKDNAERLALARRAHDTGRHCTAVRLWSEALKSGLDIAENLNALHRYNAACSAALAAAGHAKDGPAPDVHEKARFRHQALDWLSSDVSDWSRVLQDDRARLGPIVVDAMRHWQRDHDLAGVRDREALEKLPEGERREWSTLWAGVEELLRRAEGGGAPGPATANPDLPANPFSR